jgi:peptidoglycan/xylan/chitin deacetylase (PgdA/CDA1 family)
MEDLSTVPVLMYHSVGIPNPNWIWKFLTIPYEIFEDHLRMLKRKGFNTIDFAQLYDYVSSGKTIPPNPIVLTFDDGYLDNWVYAYPLLKKYGFKGTIFVNPEFVDPTEEYRPNLKDVWDGKVKEDNLAPHGFLSWREMREMEKSGVMDIQSHGMTHTWYFTGPEIVDFRHPGDPYVWMNWNKDTSKKYRYLTENQEGLFELGAPVYKHEKSLAVRRYYPDKSLDDFLTQYVKLNGGKDFFKNISWREKLFQIVKDYKGKNALNDGFESELDQRDRYEWELKESKDILEKELRKKIGFLCWPGGGKNEFSIEISKRYYLASTTSSRDQSKQKNIYGEDPSIIRRIGIPYLGDEKELNNFKYLPGLYLYWFIKEFNGNTSYRFIKKFLKLYYLLKFQLCSRI